MHGVLIPAGRRADQKILLTGAPGALSAAMVERLTPPRTDHTHVVRAAAAVSYFGPTKKKYAEMGSAVDAVVHFDAPSRAVPGELSEVIEFAAVAAAPIYFVTSAFGFAEPAAPVALLEACGLPYAIFRTSLVIGDSRTGRHAPTRRIGHFVRAIPSGSPPRHQFGNQRLLDFIPCDVVADAIARMVEFHVTDREVWLTAGDRALTLEQIVDVLAAYTREQEASLAPHRVGRESGTADQRLNSAARSLLDRLVRDEPLPSSLGDRFATALGELGALGIAALPDPEQSLLATIRYWRGSGWPRAAARGVA